MNYKLLSAAALLVAALGIAVQIIGGNLPDYPAIPPGAIVLVVAAAITGLVPVRWSPVAAVLAALFMIIGLFGADQAGRLIEVERAGDTAGLWVQMVAVVVALITGVLAMAASRPGTGRGE